MRDRFVSGPDEGLHVVSSKTATLECLLGHVRRKHCDYADACILNLLIFTAVASASIEVLSICFWRDRRHALVAGAMSQFPQSFRASSPATGPQVSSEFFPFSIFFVSLGCVVCQQSVEAL